MLNTPQAQAIVRSMVSAYREIGIPGRTYIFKFLAPAFLASLLFIIISLTLLAGTIIAPLMWVLALVAPLVAIAYPRILIGQRVNEIDEQFHFFITHLTVLSLTSTSRIDIFRTIAEEEDYGYLAEEIGSLVALVDTWNMSLEDACRVRAKKTYSDVLSDFYEQVAYNVGSGQPLSEFLINEQSAFIKEYATKYEANMNQVEFYAEIFVSFILVSAFGVVFTLLLPFLTGVNPLLIVGGVLFGTSVMQIMFVFVIEAAAPEDYLWYSPEELETPTQRKIQFIFVGSLVGVFALSIVVALLGLGYLPIPSEKLPKYFYPTIPTIPLLIPGIYTYMAENQLVTIEGQFASFIRALGAIESVKQTSTKNVLRTLRNKDFGYLTEHIVSLYRRLNMGYKSEKSWRHFSAEIGSDLIKSFADMYTLGRNLGGDPETLGIVISENFNEVMSLRQKRDQTISTVTGQLYGITIAVSVAFFVGLEIIELMVGITAGMSLPPVAAGLLNADVYNLVQLNALVFAAVLINSLVASLLIKRAQRAHTVGATLHFTLMVWVSFIGGYAVDWFFTSVSLV